MEVDTQQCRQIPCLGVIYVTERGWYKGTRPVTQYKIYS